MNLVPDRFRWPLLSRRYGGAEAARRLGMSVGTGCRVYSFNVVAEPWLITLGDKVTISNDVLFVTHDGASWLLQDSQGDRPLKYGKIKIGSQCFIGARVTIMPGVSIGDRCIVAAGTVVHRSIPAGKIVGGNPARIIGDFESYSEQTKLWPSSRDQRGSTRRERIDSIGSIAYLPELQP